MENIINQINEKNIAKVYEYEALKKHTSIQVGGKVRALCIPNSRDDLIQLIEIFKLNKVPFYILGRGSNVLPTDADMNIIIIKIANTLDMIEINNNGDIYVEAGYSLQKLSKQVSKLGLSGLEFAGGIPASIGGAVYMNAGAHSGQMKDIIEYVDVIDRANKIKRYNLQQCEFGYRESIFQKSGEIIIAVKLKLEVGGRAEVFKRMIGNLEYRKEMQPLDRPTFGSVFQNPKGFYSAALIEQVGLKGKKYGGAHISTKHSNFIVNHGDAKTEDILYLIETIKTIVQDETGVKLNNEVIFLDESSSQIW